jgi:hypothetical protein
MAIDAVLFLQKIASKFGRTLLLSILAFIVSLSSTLAWRVADIDFVTRIGSGRLTIVYIYVAIVVFASSALIFFKNNQISPRGIFQAVQKYATSLFILIGTIQAFFDVKENIWLLYSIKIFGYAYSILLFNAFWIALDPCNKHLHPSKLQTSLYSFSLYLGMATAGLWLQSHNVEATNVGIVAIICSLLCWIIGQYAFPSSLTPTTKVDGSSAKPHHASQIVQLLIHSKKLILLVLVSLFFSILVRSAEYCFIADFETRYLSVDNADGNLRPIGSFVTLIGLGNIITLISWQIWNKWTIGRASLPLATLAAFFMMKLCSTTNYSLLTSVLILIVVESLYAIIVESNLQHLLEHFDEQDKSVTRVLIDAIVEPSGLLLSATFFLLPGFSIPLLGGAIIITASMVLLYNWKHSRDALLANSRSVRRFLTSLCTFERKKKDRAVA